MTDPTVTIGRDLQSSILLQDDEVSRVHCTILVESSRVVLVDEGSSNGTYLNGSSISRAEIQLGDNIRVGKTQFEFNSFLQISVDQENASSLTAFPNRVSCRESSEISPQNTELLSQSETNTDSVGVLCEPEKGIVEDSSNGKDSNQLMSNQRLVEMPNELGLVYQTSLAIDRALDLDTTFHEVMKLIFDWLPVDRGCIFLAQPNTDEFEVRHVKKRVAEGSPLKMDFDQAIFDYVVSNKVGVMSPPISYDDNQSIESRQTRQISNQVICVPVQNRDEVFGVLYVDSHRPFDNDSCFVQENLREMLLVAQQIAAAIENLRFKTQNDSIRCFSLGEGSVFAELSLFIDHRINNIVQGINGATHLVETGLESDNLELCKKGWTINKKNQARVIELLYDLMKLGSPLVLDPRPYDIAELVGRATSSMESSLSEAGLSVQLPPIGDPESIASVDQCSFTTCLEHMVRLVIAASDGKGTEIRFSITRDEQGLKLVIVHPGSPLQTVRTSPEGKQELHSTTLAVAQRIVEAHEGRITVRAADSTSQVTISLPLQT